MLLFQRTRIWFAAHTYSGSRGSDTLWPLSALRREDKSNQLNCSREIKAGLVLEFEAGD